MSLLKSILKRLASSIVVLLGLTIIIFILMRIVPGDPARLALGANVSGRSTGKLQGDQSFK